MLSQWIVAKYQTLVEIALWVSLLVGGLLGARIGEMTGNILQGFIIGAVGCFFWAAMSLGAALMLGEILKSVKDIQNRPSADNDRPRTSNPNSQSVTKNSDEVADPWVSSN